MDMSREERVRIARDIAAQVKAAHKDAWLCINGAKSRWFGEDHVSATEMDNTLRAEAGLPPRVWTPAAPEAEKVVAIDHHNNGRPDVRGGHWDK